MIKQEEIIIKVGNWIKPKFNKIERMLVLFTFISYGVYISSIKQGSVFLIIALLLLSVLYFFNAFALVDKEFEDGPNVFIKYVSGWTWSMIIIGVMFYLQGFPGENFMLKVGVLCSIAIMGFSASKLISNTQSKKMFQPIFIRTIIFVFIALFFIIIPKKELVDKGIVKERVINKTPTR